MPGEIAIDLPHPTQLSRAQLLVRLLILLATGGAARLIGWPGTLLYFGLPALAAILVAQHGPTRYLATDAPRILGVLDWLLAFVAYMELLTDEFPLGGPRPVRYDFQPSGTPTVGSAVLRIVTSIPAAFVLALLGFVSAIVTLLAAIAILFTRHYPRSWFDFQCGVLRVYARVLAYHTSLTDQYPTFTFHATPTLPAARAV
jgi:hypothetical protein